MNIERQIKQHMRATLRAGECIDRHTGIADCTKLAEETAHALGHSEWLDDDQHIVWDIAIEVAEDLGFGDHA